MSASDVQYGALQQGIAGSEEAETVVMVVKGEGDCYNERGIKPGFNSDRTIDFT